MFEELLDHFVDSTVILLSDESGYCAERKGILTFAAPNWVVTETDGTTWIFITADVLNIKVSQKDFTRICCAYLRS